MQDEVAAAAVAAAVVAAAAAAAAENGNDSIDPRHQWYSRNRHRKRLPCVRFVGNLMTAGNPRRSAA